MYNADAFTDRLARRQVTRDNAVDMISHAIHGMANLNPHEISCIMADTAEHVGEWVDGFANPANINIRQIQSFVWDSVQLLNDNRPKG